jgi:hypothetical protein
MSEPPDRRSAAHGRIDEVLEAIINDPQLRLQIAIDPEAALVTLGLSLTERTLLLTWLREAN